MTAVAQDARSQPRNRELALERLAERLAARAGGAARRARDDEADGGRAEAPPAWSRRSAAARQIQAGPRRRADDSG